MNPEGQDDRRDQDRCKKTGLYLLASDPGDPSPVMPTYSALSPKLRRASPLAPFGLLSPLALAVALVAAAGLGAAGLWLTWPDGMAEPPPPFPVTEGPETLGAPSDADSDRAAMAARAPALPEWQSEPLRLGAAMMIALEEESLPATIRRRVEVRRGDTLMNLLVEAGAGRSEAHAAITALAETYSPKNLKPGQAIELTFAPANPTADAGDAGDQRLLGLTLRPSVEQDIQVLRRSAEEGFVSRVIERPLSRHLAPAAGEIEVSLFVAGQEAGIPTPVMIDLIRIYSFDVDFQREIRQGDSFRLLYESYQDITGQPAKTGEILFASLTLRGVEKTLYRFTPKSGNSDYFDDKGRSVRKTLMRTPIDGARLSSGFGLRKHPILGYSRMHRGVDFAAPRGTPIYAAGDGTIERAGRNGGYGKYIRIRHNGSYKTAYAHMKGYAKGIKKGKRVKQGQIIGYVGSTGRSTGPHLHYEVIHNGKQVNPRKIKLPSGETLKGQDLENFQAARAEIDALYRQSQGTTQIACGQKAGAEEPSC